MLILGIDTSNYATSLAVLEAETGKLVYNAKQFLPVKQGERGLRQSDAVFHHTQALPALFQQAAAQVCMQQLGAVAVSCRPRPQQGSYMPCFTVGIGFAEAVCAATGLPLIKTTHQQGHIAAALFACQNSALYEAQTLVFHVSGGTTDLLLCQNFEVQQLGSSTDLYAGQAVDRIGVRLGYSFPAGQEVSRLAAECTEKTNKPKISVSGMNCSFSGLENQCNHLLETGHTPQYTAKYCLTAISATLERMAQAALEQYPRHPVIFAGGVMSSGVIRDYFSVRHPKYLFVDGKFASDNAIGICVIAARSMGYGC